MVLLRKGCLHAVAAASHPGTDRREGRRLSAPDSVFGKRNSIVPLLSGGHGRDARVAIATETR